MKHIRVQLRTLRQACVVCISISNVLFLMLWARPVGAHITGRSASHIALSERTPTALYFSVLLDLDADDLQESLKHRFDTDGSGFIDPIEYYRHRLSLGAMLAGGLQLKYRGHECRAKVTGFEPPSGQGAGRWNLRYRCIVENPGPKTQKRGEGAALEENSAHAPAAHSDRAGDERSRVSDLSGLVLSMPLLLSMRPKHQHLLVLDGGEQGKTISHLMDAENWEIGQNAGATSERFISPLRQGFLHVTSGYDHLLFVFCLFLIPMGKKRLLWLLSTFTLAHSITLSLVAFKVASVPLRIVDPLVCLSIIAVAGHTLKRGHHRVSQHFYMEYITVFFFGLIHGLGFGAGLAELSTQVDLLLVLAFNMGVELAQMAVLVPFAMLLWLLSRTWKHPQIYAGAWTVMGAVLLWPYDTTLSVTFLLLGLTWTALWKPCNGRTILHWTNLAALLMGAGLLIVSLG